MLAMLQVIGESFLSAVRFSWEVLVPAHPAVHKIAVGASALILGLGALYRRPSNPLGKTAVVLGASTLAWGFWQLWNRDVRELPIYGPPNLCDLKPDFCEGNLGICRRDMPQFNESVGRDFVQWWSDRGAPVEHALLDASQLKATQNEINWWKVEGMLERHRLGTLNATYRRILASGKGELVDGHHRWAFCRLAGLPVNVTVVDAPIQALLETAAQFKGVVRYDLENRLNP